MINEIIFWACAILIFYVYLGYPFLLILINQIYKKPWKKSNITPSISIIISAYNEEKAIEKTIRSILELEYPENKKEIIIINDGSADKTEEIIKKYFHKGIKLINLKKNLGKTNAQNIAVKETKGEILVFMDAGTLYKEDALKKLVRNFADQKVGGVSGIEQTTGQRRNYLGYEEFIRAKESQISSVFVVNGCLYAVRKNLYKKINEKLASDFVIGSKIIEQGYRFIHEKEAIAFEKSNKDISKEFKMRVRVAVRTCTGLFEIKRLLNPFRFGFVSFELFSHKILRYMCSFLMILIFILNIFLIGESFIYLLTIWAQILFYLFALSGLKIKRLKIVTYFVMSNMAIVIGILKFIFGKRTVSWTPLR